MRRTRPPPHRLDPSPCLDPRPTLDGSERVIVPGKEKGKWAGVSTGHLEFFWSPRRKNAPGRGSGAFSGCRDEGRYQRRPFFLGRPLFFLVVFLAATFFLGRPLFFFLAVFLGAAFFLVL